MSILEKFTVIDLIKTRSASVATITGNVLKFNNQTAAELHFAPYIQVLINPKDKQFAIRGCKEDAPNAVPFSKPEGEQKYQIKISAAAVVDMIRKMANWSAEDNWNIPGVYFAEDDALVWWWELISCRPTRSFLFSVSHHIWAPKPFSSVQTWQSSVIC